MLTQDEMDKVVLEAKKSLSEEQMKDALRKCTYGGPMVHAGGFVSKDCIPNICVDTVLPHKVAEQFNKLAQNIEKGGVSLDGKTNT